MRRRSVLFAVAALVATAFPMASASADGDHPGLTPTTVDEDVAVGGAHIDVAKTVHTPEVPPAVDVCLLVDETGSFSGEIGNLKDPVTSNKIFDDVTAATSDAQFAVAGFRDYPVPPYGHLGEHVYRLSSGMSPAKAGWLAGIAALTAVGGNDSSEAQYDAIVASLGPGQFNDPSLLVQDPCGFRYANPQVTHLLVVATDARFHLPGAGKPHVNDQAATIAELNAAGGGKGVVVVGLKATTAGGELDALAAATGGSTQLLSFDGANIGQAIIAGLQDIQVEVSMISDCAAETGGPITTDFSDPVRVTSGADAEFTETIWVADDAAPGDYHCQDWALINGAPMVDEAGDIIFEEKWITVLGPFCEPTENPHGNTVPRAPDNGGQGRNQDGFYEIGSTTGEAVFVVDEGSGTLFGPFPTPTNIKYAEDEDAVPEMKPMGGNSGSGNGEGVAVDWQIIGNGDALVLDGVASTACLVPPPPK